MLCRSRFAISRRQAPSLFVAASAAALTLAFRAHTASALMIDSHLHVWANTAEAASSFPYTQDPPDQLRDKACTKELLRHMKEADVDGALIVQPINHKFDHSYVVQAMKDHPTKFKGMLLHDPALPEDLAVSRLEDLALQGFVGVRFNPYLWPKDDADKLPPMSSTLAGCAVYKRCAQLHMPVGVMCFQGLALHYNDLKALLELSPETIMILDHFGFTDLSDEGDAAFALLLDLAKTYPQLVVKISALFRLKDDTAERTRVRTERFEPLLQELGPDRLMMGTDFPFVLEQPESYGGTVSLIKLWLNNNPESEKAVLGGTAERLFGPWGKS